MIAPHNDDKPRDPMGDYGGGVSAKRVRLEETRMLERALRERWPIPEHYREAIVTRQIRIAIDPGSSSREATSAARCLVSMEGQNLDDQHKAIDKRMPDLHAVGGLVEHRVTVAELLEHPEYADWLRERERHSDAGHASANGHAGHGKPVDDGPSRNGH
jgi:hypothetical protein